MKKFKFRLEQVLKYRQTVKEEKKRVLAMANAELQSEETRLAEYEEQQKNGELPQGGVCDVSQFIMVGLYQLRLKELIIKQKLTIIQAKDKVEHARLEYIAASKESKALEMLKEKRLKEYDEYVAKEDEKFLDELVTQRVGHQILEEQ